MYVTALYFHPPHEVFLAWALGMGLFSLPTIHWTCKACDLYSPQQRMTTLGGPADT